MKFLALFCFLILIGLSGWGCWTAFSMAIASPASNGAAAGPFFLIVFHLVAATCLTGTYLTSKDK